MSENVCSLSSALNKLGLWIDTQEGTEHDKNEEQEGLSVSPHAPHAPLTVAGAAYGSRFVFDDGVMIDDDDVVDMIVVIEELENWKCLIEKYYSDINGRTFFRQHHVSEHRMIPIYNFKRYWQIRFPHAVLTWQDHTHLVNLSTQLQSECENAHNLFQMFQHRQQLRKTNFMQDPQCIKGMVELYSDIAASLATSRANIFALLTDYINVFMEANHMPHMYDDAGECGEDVHWLHTLVRKYISYGGTTPVSPIGFLHFFRTQWHTISDNDTHAICNAIEGCVATPHSTFREVSTHFTLWIDRNIDSLHPALSQVFQ